MLELSTSQGNGWLATDHAGHCSRHGESAPRRHRAAESRGPDPEGGTPASERDKLDRRVSGRGLAFRLRGMQMIDISPPCPGVRPREAMGVKKRHSLEGRVDARLINAPAASVITDALGLIASRALRVTGSLCLGSPGRAWNRAARTQRAARAARHPRNPWGEGKHRGTRSSWRARRHRPPRPSGNPR